MLRPGFWTVPRLVMLLGVLGIGALCFGPRYAILAHERAAQQVRGMNLLPAAGLADDELGALAGETQRATFETAETQVSTAATSATPAATLETQAATGETQIAPPETLAATVETPETQVEPAAETPIETTAETQLETTAQPVTPLPADVQVRVLAQDGTPLDRVGVLARLESAGGELLAETWARSAADGRLVFPAWGRFAREQALGTMLRIVFERDDPGELVLRAASLRNREFTMVRTIDFDREFDRAAASLTDPGSEASINFEPLAESGQVDPKDASVGAGELVLGSQVELGQVVESKGEAREDSGALAANHTTDETALVDVAESAANAAPASEAPRDFSDAQVADHPVAEQTPAEQTPAEQTAVEQTTPELTASDQSAADQTLADQGAPGAAVVPMEPGVWNEPNTQRSDAPVRTLPSGTPRSQASTKAPPREVPGGALAGRLLLDVPAREVFVELDEVLPLDPERVGRRLGPVVPDANGRFEFQDVQPGLCAVRVGLFGSRRTLMWVDNLVVPVGAVLNSDALQSLDLRGRLGSIGVDVYDELGQRLESAVVAPLELGSGLVGRLRVQAPGATARVYFDRQALNGPGSLDLRIEAPGFAPRDVLVTEAELTAGPDLAFALERLNASPLELRLVGAVSEPGKLVAQLVRPDGQVRPWDFAAHRGSFDRDGRLRLAPVETGAFLVRVLRPVGEAWQQVGTDVPIELAPDDGERDIVFIPLTE